MASSGMGMGMGMGKQGSVKAQVAGRWLGLAPLAFSACEGAVDLGIRGRGASGGQPPADDPYAVTSDRLAAPAHVFLRASLAVAGDFLYAPGDYNPTPKNRYDRPVRALYRCRKASCASSWERLPILDDLFSLQVMDQRLAVAGIVE